MRLGLTGLLASAASALVLAASPAAAQELTIFWAEWDPANYLQELVNLYTEETGVVVTVETTPWPDFQTKAFTEFNAKGTAYDMVVGDSQWLGAGSTGGHYVDLTDFFAEHKVAEIMAPATVDAYAEYDGKYWAIPAEGDATGWAYRKDWFEDPAEMAAFKEKYGYDLATPKTWAELRDIAEFFHRPDEGRYGVAIYTDNSYDALVMGYENALFSYGGDLGDYSTYEVDGIVNSDEGGGGARDVPRALRLHPAELGQDLLPGGQPGDHRGPGGDEHELLRLLPGARQPGDQPARRGHRILRQPGGAGRHAARGARRSGHLGRQLLAEPGGGVQVPRVVHPRGGAAEVGRARRLHRHAATLESEEFRNATPYNEAFYQSMFMVKDFWAVPEYAELLTQINNRIYPFVVGGEGTAKEALDGLAQDWAETFKKYGRM